MLVSTKQMNVSDTVTFKIIQFFLTLLELSISTAYSLFFRVLQTTLKLKRVFAEIFNFTLLSLFCGQYLRKMLS